MEILNGKHLKISGNHFPPYIYSTTHNGQQIFGGANYQIVESASVKYNFTFDLDAPKGKPTGIKLPNGTWNGLFADVLYNKSDLAIVLAHTGDRNGLIDFTSPFGAANLVFSTALPQVSIKSEAIINSYSVQVWLFILLTFVIGVLAFYVSMVVLFHSLSLRGRRQSPSWTISLMTTFKIFMEQNAAIHPGTKLIANCLLVFVIIIGTGYKCNLLASLSFPHVDKIPQNFPDLAEYEDYKIYFDMSGIVGYNYFMKGNVSTIVKLRERFKHNLVKNNPAKCVISSFIKPMTACIAWDTVLNQVIGQNLTLVRGLHTLFKTQVSVTTIWVTIGLQKHSIYTPAFSFIVSSYFETGWIAKWHQEIVKNFESIGKSWMMTQTESRTYKSLLHILAMSTRGVTALKFENLQIVFLVLALGLGTAFCSFFIEVNYKFFRHPRLLSHQLEKVVLEMKGMKRIQQKWMGNISKKLRTGGIVGEIDMTGDSSLY